MSLLFLAGCVEPVEVYDHVFMYNPTDTDFDVLIQRLRTSNIDCTLLSVIPGSLVDMAVVETRTQTVPSKQLIGLNYGMELSDSRNCYAYTLSVEGMEHHVITELRRTTGLQEPLSAVSLPRNTVLVRPGDDVPWSDGGAGILYEVDPDPVCEPTARFGWELDQDAGAFLLWGRDLSEGCFALLDLDHVEVGEVCAAGHAPFEVGDRLEVLDVTVETTLDLVRSDGVGLTLSEGGVYPKFSILMSDPLPNPCVYTDEACLGYVDRPVRMLVDGWERELRTGEQTSWLDLGVRRDLFVIRSATGVNYSCRLGGEFVLVTTLW